MKDRITKDTPRGHLERIIAYYCIFGIALMFYGLAIYPNVFSEPTPLAIQAILAVAGSFFICIGIKAFKERNHPDAKFWRD